MERSATYRLLGNTAECVQVLQGLQQIGFILAI
jgi:hypothetical protein